MIFILNGRTLMINRTRWVIMDKQHGLIAAGVRRNRKLVALAEGSDARILTYTTEKKARLGFVSYGFYVTEAAEEYIEAVFDIDRATFMRNREKFLEPVRVKIMIEAY